VWVPLGFDEHQLAVRAFHLTPLTPAPAGAPWIDIGLAGPFNAANAEGTVRRLLASGRPVYLSTLLAYQVPFLPQLLKVLSARFTLEPVGVAQLLRIRGTGPS
jgi:hypothetical protein